MAARLSIFRQPTPEEAWGRLQPLDIERWVDRTCLARALEYVAGGRVETLHMSGDGELLAWVRGGERYAVRVRLEEQQGKWHFVSLCTCPIEKNCKHAVAAAVAYLDSARE